MTVASSLHIPLNDDAKPRINRSKYPTLHLLGIIVSLSCLTLSVLFIGSRVQTRRVRHAPSTVNYYTMSTVCATHTSATLNEVSTFDNVSIAHAESQLVVHCGPCAACSNFNDISKYVTHRQNLTAVTLKCAMKGLWSGRSGARECMDIKVGFSNNCTDCWLADIQCSMKHCLIPCLKYKLFREPNNKPDGTLNDCLACDEKLCGPDFIQCSGVNRRRLGVNSDIFRNNTIEMCPYSDFAWFSMDIL